jgi:hypothetical protein
MILSFSLQMTADEYAVFEPLALAYIERCREALASGDYSRESGWLTLEGLMPRFRRGEDVHLETDAFLAVADPIADLTDCSSEVRAVLEAMRERLYESETVDIQTIRPGQKPYVTYGEQKRLRRSQS